MNNNLIPTRQLTLLNENDILFILPPIDLQYYHFPRKIQAGFLRRDIHTSICSYIKG